jgi:hypothetical protein
MYSTEYGEATMRIVRPHVTHLEKARPSFNLKPASFDPLVKSTVQYEVQRQSRDSQWNCRIEASR